VGPKPGVEPSESPIVWRIVTFHALLRSEAHAHSSLDAGVANERAPTSSAEYPCETPSLMTNNPIAVSAGAAAWSGTTKRPEPGTTFLMMALLS
jgi:hypothetical protein